MRDLLANAKFVAETQLIEKVNQYDTLIQGRLHASVIPDPETQALLNHRNALVEAWFREDVRNDPYGLLYLARQQYKQSADPEPSVQRCEMLVEYEQC